MLLVLFYLVGDVPLKRTLCIIGAGFLCKVATNLENRKYSGISVNMENSWNSQGILCNLRENWLHCGCSLCQAIHMQPNVSGAWKLFIWAIWDDRLLLVTWVVVDVEWHLIHKGHYYVFFCNNLWKSIIVALKNHGKPREFFSATLWPPCYGLDAVPVTC